ncbi:MAG: 50S ribosomal protein L18 [Candidatus Vogelbacteria bacterium CG10_big_fil_rev_8_21_14_0_10_51_16]|uniref:Large ribosomal subunit protein uL18 n=1 Tax=Candidatus Vogelbacteria bacterium CG10_big_fil_rev_8_21_14_0_10_51_16 TaxID=1975045 RepID=A0A2H0RFM1_9BACT|nr:MAG: 50S ribosomal protein L18 [Candidatus Vogelbacteria bacterium CG10_big_fil_rev_8_21_14_0_10_51_16]
MKNKTQQKSLRRERRQGRIRARVSGTATRPRLSVFRSNTKIYAQLIDDEVGLTIASAHSMGSKETRLVSAENTGNALAKAAKEKNVHEAVFDRAGYLFTGRVKAVAEGARKGGLKF